MGPISNAGRIVNNPCSTVIGCIYTTVAVAVAELNSLIVAAIQQL